MTTAEQRAAALDAANQIRVDRAKLKLRIGAREVSAARVLEDMPECMRSCGVYQFLTFIPYVGKRKRPDADRTAKAFQLLRRADCIQFGHRRLDRLTPYQHARLLKVVRDYEQARHPSERGLV